MLITLRIKSDNMFNMSDRAMEKAMKQMGIKSENIEADEVIIKCKGKDIIISNPSITKIDMKGAESFQIAGEVSERGREKFSEDDIKMIAEQTGKTEVEAKKALEDTNDIAEAIMKLKT